MSIPKIIETRPPIRFQEAQLGEFIATGAVTHIQAKGNAIGFELHIDIGAVSGVLGNSHGIVRTFISLNTLAGLVRRLGADRFDVVIGAFGSDQRANPVKRGAKSEVIAPTSSRSKSSSVSKPKRQAIGRNK